LNCKTTKRIPAPPTPGSGSAALDFNLSDDLDPAPGVSALRDFNSQSQPMSSGSYKQSDEPTIRMKKPRKYRSLPLSARQDAGHVVFRGNERLYLDKGGLGICFM
jgi:ribonuclease P protein subunit RPR2